MTSFRLGIKPTRRASARFVAKARRKLQQAVVRAAGDGISQSDIAREIGVHRSLISRELNGEANLSLGRFAEIAQALGGEPEIDIIFPDRERGRNAPAGGIAAGRGSTSVNTTTKEMTVKAGHERITGSSDLSDQQANIRMWVDS